MKGLEALDLKMFATKAVSAVFDTMLSMPVECVDSAEGLPPDGSKVVGSVSFVGKVTGAVSIHMSSDFARIMTADMVGIPPEEVQGEEDISDVIGEFSNMVGGDMKSRFCDAGFPCVLSIPSITIGKNFRIQVRDWAIHEKFLFRHQDHRVLVEVCVKANV